MIVWAMLDCFHLELLEIAFGVFSSQPWILLQE
jgi:hypothetical protein